MPTSPSGRPASKAFRSAVSESHRVNGAENKSNQICEENFIGFELCPGGGIGRHARLRAL